VRLSGWRCQLANSSAMNSSLITYAPRSDTTASAELSTLAAVYKLCLESSRAKQNAPGVTNTKGDNAMKGSNYDRAKDIIPE
jgi:hypothetical protein